MVISFQSKQLLFSRSLGQRKKWHQIINDFVMRDEEFRCSRYYYFFVLYKYTMLTTSCIIPWDLGFVDHQIILKLSLGYSVLRSKIGDKNTFGYYQGFGAKSL